MSDNAVSAGLHSVSLRGLFALAALHRTGDYRAASHQQGLDLSTHSRRISNLEKELAVRLVEEDQDTRKLKLTLAARPIGKAAHEFLCALERALTD